jgi:protein associated with RNAse G/E
MKLQPGMHILIHSYKHNKTVHRIWKKSVVLEVSQHVIVTANERTRVIENDGRTWKTKEPAICVFFEDLWFNIIAMLKQDGIHYYCNLASPTVFDGEALKYIDYDLDLKMYPSKKIRLLDKKEYETHKQQMEYPKDIDDIILDHLRIIKEKMMTKSFPFQDDVMYQYYEIYKTYQ